jgi:hypothetical protein
MRDIAVLRKLVAQRRADGLSLNAACAQIADELDPERWTGGYLKTLLGKNPPKPGDDLRAAVRRLHRSRSRRKPRPRRYWLKVEAESEEEKIAWIEMIPMARRQELFRQEINRLLRGDEQEEQEGRLLALQRELRRLLGLGQ